MSKLNIYKVILVLVGLVFCVNTVEAAKTYNDADSALNTVVQKTGIEQTDVFEMFGRTVKIAFLVIGTLFFALMVYAGLLWMTARGEEEQVTKARKTLIAAGIGIFILVGSYAGTMFVQSRIIEGQRGTPIPLSPDTMGDEPLGCCYDWVSSQASGSIPVPAWRITTYSDCKYYGENDGNGDFYSGSEGEGFWLWQDGISAAKCQADLP